MRNLIDIVESASTVPWTWTMQKNANWRAEFTIGTVKYQVRFDYERFFVAWEMSFTAQAPNAEASVHRTNTGNQFKVYATVVDVTEEFMDTMQPDKLKINSDRYDTGRHSVNRSLAYKLAKHTDYEVDQYLPWVVYLTKPNHVQ